MPNCFVNFLKRRDELGSPVILHYKEENGFGTCLGGCISFLLTIFMTSFVTFQIYAWMFAVDYRSEIEVTYLSRKDNETYTIPTTQFLPMFEIVDYYGTGMEDPKYWTVDWKQYSDGD